MPLHQRVRGWRATTKAQIGATNGHMRTGKVRRTASRHSRLCTQAQTCLQEHPRPTRRVPRYASATGLALEHNNPFWENTQLHCTGQLSTCVGRTPQVRPSSEDWETFPHLTRSHWVISSGGTVPASTGARTRPGSRFCDTTGTGAIGGSAVVWMSAQREAYPPPPPLVTITTTTAPPTCRHDSVDTTTTTTVHLIASMLPRLPPQQA